MTATVATTIQRKVTAPSRSQPKAERCQHCRGKLTDARDPANGKIVQKACPVCYRGNLMIGDDRTTPDYILDVIRKHAGPIALDPCGNPWDNVNAARSLQRHRGENGLRVDWEREGHNWVNPPFGGGQLQVWADKIVREAALGSPIHAITPADHTTGWYRTLYETDYVRHLVNIDHRVEYGPLGGGGNMWPATLWYFNDTRNPALETACEELGYVLNLPDMKRTP